MQDKVLVSVILPVRNLETYIAEAIESVKRQTEKRWELIIVDDASEDMTQDICRKYTDTDKIQYIRSDMHIGVSKARNIGLDVVVGDYIVFMDGDDVLPENSLALRVNLIEQADLVVGGYVVQGTDICIPDEPGEYTVKKYWERIKFFQARKAVGIEFVWDKIFLNQIIRENGLRFRENMSIQEDLFFVMDYISFLNRYRDQILVTEDVVYEYRNRAGSSSKNYNIKLFEKIKLMFAKIQAEMEKHGVFYGEAKEGFCHGYVNKMIGQIYAFVINENITENKLNYLYNLLSTDKTLQYGLVHYVCKNQYEGKEIVDLMITKIIGGGVEELREMLSIISMRLSRE